MAREAGTVVERLLRCLEECPEDTEQAAALAAKLGALRQDELVRLVRSLSLVRSTLNPRQREVLERCKF